MKISIHEKLVEKCELCSTGTRRRKQSQSFPPQKFSDTKAAERRPTPWRQQSLKYATNAPSFSSSPTPGSVRFVTNLRNDPSSPSLQERLFRFSATRLCSRWCRLPETTVLTSAHVRARSRRRSRCPPLFQRAGLQPAQPLEPAQRDSLRSSVSSDKMPHSPSGVGLQISGKDTLELGHLSSIFVGLNA